MNYPDNLNRPFIKIIKMIIKSHCSLGSFENTIDDMIGLMINEGATTPQEISVLLGTLSKRYHNLAK